MLINEEKLGVHYFSLRRTSAKWLVNYFLVQISVQIRLFPILESLSGPLSLELTNITGTAKFMGSTLTRTCFFKREIFFSNKIVGLCCVCLFFVGLVAVSLQRFLLLSAFINIVF